MQNNTNYIAIVVQQTFRFQLLAGISNSFESFLSPPHGGLGDRYSGVSEILSVLTSWPWVCHHTLHRLLNSVNYRHHLQLKTAIIIKHSMQNITHAQCCFIAVLTRDV